MIDTIDQQLKDWVSSTAADADVRLDMPPAEVDRPVASLTLYEIDNAVPSRRDGPRPIEMTLRYLVTAHDKTVEAAHRLLSELLFAALANSDMEVDVRPPPLDVWLAFGIAPQPAFRIGVPLVRERPDVTPLITQPVRISAVPVKSITGAVLSPDGVPISQARVEIPGTTHVAYTNVRGLFRFRNVSTFSDRQELRVVARGIEQVISDKFNTDEPIVIRFQPQENRHG